MSDDSVISDDQRLAGDRVYLRLVQLTDCGDRYQGWLADAQVNRFLETRWAEHTGDSIREFVSRMRESDSDYLFAIIEADGDRHVGNIKLGPINPVHRHADVSYFIGERDMWGKGIATEAIRIATRFGFERLKLHRLQAVVSSANMRSAKALERAGFFREGLAREKLWTGEGWSDQVSYGILGIPPVD